MNNRSAPPSSPSLVEDFVFDEDAPRTFSPANDNGDDGPPWVWVLVRASGRRQVWVRYQAEDAPEGLCTRAARPPSDDDSDGVAIVEARRPRAPEDVPLDRRALAPDLVTVREFAALVGCAESSVFELLRLGLPSFKSKHLGRRIKRTQALAWLAEGGAERSRIAKRIARDKSRNGGAQ